jgi:hypothetical protein
MKLAREVVTQALGRMRAKGIGSSRNGKQENGPSSQWTDALTLSFRKILAARVICKAKDVNMNDTY